MTGEQVAALDAALATEEAVGELTSQRNDLRILAAVVESSDDSIITTSPEGVITSWNSGAERLYGYTEDEARGQHITMLISPQAPGAFSSTLSRLSDQDHVRVESLDVRKDGSEVVASVTFSNVFDGHGKLKGLVGIARDITEQRRAEDHERRTARQLEHCEYLQGYYFGKPHAFDTAAPLASRADAAMRSVQGAVMRMSSAVVLVVDDDPLVRQVVGSSLAGAGFEVREAASGSDALAMAALVRPDCFLIDLGLPDMDGVDVVASLRAKAELADVAVIVLTAAAGRDTKIAAFSAGADDYIVKPILPQHLAPRVRGALRARQTGLPPHDEATKQPPRSPAPCVLSVGTRGACAGILPRQRVRAHNETLGRAASRTSSDPRWS
ncbi:MAG TPA: response regulator [Acidimicrobiales bacterium]|nr:response regulator [Acidimicrobiales bacterium]